MTKPCSFTLDVTIIKQLDVYCKQSLIPKSRLINNLLKEFLKTKGYVHIQNDKSN